MTEIRTIYCDGCNNKLENLKWTDDHIWMTVHKGKILNHLCGNCSSDIIDFIEKRKLQVKV